MKYIFHEGELVGEYPIESIQTCWYDGTDMMNDMCFDEEFRVPENFTYSDLTYIETEEEQFEKKDHSRVFIHMKDGSIHELELRKLSQEEIAECSYYYGGRRKNKSLSVSEQCEIISAKLQREIEYLESLPPEKAKIYAKNSLMRIGIIDENGDLTEQYGGKATSDGNKCDKERENEQIIRAVNVRALNDYLIIVKFENNEEKIFNCYSLLNDEMYSDIKDKDYFKLVHIDDMGLVCWDEATDINPYVLYNSSISVKDLKL